MTIVDMMCSPFCNEAPARVFAGHMGVLFDVAHVPIGTKLMLRITRNLPRVTIKALIKEALEAMLAGKMRRREGKPMSLLACFLQRVRHSQFTTEAQVQGCGLQVPDWKKQQTANHQCVTGPSYV